MVLCAKILYLKKKGKTEFCWTQCNMHISPWNYISQLDIVISYIESYLLKLDTVN